MWEDNTVSFNKDLMIWRERIQKILKKLQVLVLPNSKMY